MVSVTSEATSKRGDSQMDGERPRVKLLHRPPPNGFKSSRVFNAKVAAFAIVVVTTLVLWASCAFAAWKAYDAATYCHAEPACDQVAIVTDCASCLDDVDKAKYERSLKLTAQTGCKQHVELLDCGIRSDCAVATASTAAPLAAAVQHVTPTNTSTGNYSISMYCVAGYRTNVTEEQIPDVHTGMLGSAEYETCDSTDRPACYDVIVRQEAPLTGYTQRIGCNISVLEALDADAPYLLSECKAEMDPVPLSDDAKARYERTGKMTKKDKLAKRGCYQLPRRKDMWVCCCHGLNTCQPPDVTFEVQPRTTEAPTTTTEPPIEWPPSSIDCFVDEHFIKTAPCTGGVCYALYDGDAATWRDPLPRMQPERGCSADSSIANVLKAACVNSTSSRCFTTTVAGKDVSACCCSGTLCNPSGPLSSFVACEVHADVTWRSLAVHLLCLALPGLVMSVGAIYDMLATLPQPVRPTAQPAA